VKPEFSKSRVAKAGGRIREDRATDEDWQVLENWRRAHAYVLNTFQMRLRSTRKRFEGQVQVAQRHKRRPTIVDKLTREPGMKLDRMHDIAGCRAIFPDIDSLDRFRTIFLDTRAKHRHVNAKDDRYDYIANPKASGYRGIHDVFETVLESESGSRWNGLRVEVQFRTGAQHAWATAVETVDLLNGERAKFGQASPELQRFFAVASELIARAHEGKVGPLPDLTSEDLVREFRTLDQELGIMERLTRAVASNPPIRRGKNVILIFHLKGDQELEVRSYDSIAPAQEAYAELEKELDGKADIVLVKAEHAEDLKRAFQNYFTDAKYRAPDFPGQ
jgi:ppGpp synthetase/RelA/SpoT-type nucleotidyltranferase